MQMQQLVEAQQKSVSRRNYECKFLLIQSNQLAKPKSVCVQASDDASEHKLLRNGVIHSENEEKYE